MIRRWTRQAVFGLYLLGAGTAAFAETTPDAFVARTQILLDRCFAYLNGAAFEMDGIEDWDGFMLDRLTRLTVSFDDDARNCVLRAMPHYVGDVGIDALSAGFDTFSDRALTLLPGAVRIDYDTPPDGSKAMRVGLPNAGPELFIDRTDLRHVNFAWHADAPPVVLSNAPNSDAVAVLDDCIQALELDRGPRLSEMHFHGEERWISQDGGWQSTYDRRYGPSCLVGSTEQNTDPNAGLTGLRINIANRIERGEFLKPDVVVADLHPYRQDRLRRSFREESIVAALCLRSGAIAQIWIGRKRQFTVSIRPLQASPCEERDTQ